MSQNHSAASEKQLTPSNMSDEWSDLELRERPKTWRDNQWVPIGMFGAAVCFAGFLVMKGKGDGRGLSQRVMEARVAAQATLLAGILGTGYILGSSSAQQKKSSWADEKH